MANVCINQFSCSTDVEANYLHILYWLYDNFDVYYLDGNGHWMQGEFTSKWKIPEKAFRQLTKELESDVSLYIRILRQPYLGRICLYKGLLGTFKVRGQSVQKRTMDLCLGL